MTNPIARWYQSVGRSVLRAWARSAKAPGWHYRIMESIGSSLAGDNLVTARLVNGCQMNCDLRDHVQRQIYFLGAYEPITSYLFTRLLHPGMIVIDGGANVGQFTLLASTGVGPHGQVHSFEPVPATFDRLRFHIRSNGLRNVHLNQAALWRQRERLTLSLPQEMLDNLGAYSAGFECSRTEVEAPALTLDDYVAESELQRVDLVKLDVEGAELFALQGMEQVLDRHRPLLLVEVCRETTARFGYDPRDLWTLLHDRFGYSAWSIRDRSRSSRQLDDLNAVVQQNILFYPDELPTEIKGDWDLKTCLRWAA